MEDVMQNIKKILILGILLSVTFLTKTSTELEIVNGYKKTINVTIRVVNRREMGDKRWDEFQGTIKPNESFDPVITGIHPESILNDTQLVTIEWQAIGFHIPGAYDLGSILEKQWGGRRLIDCEEIKKIIPKAQRFVQKYNTEKVNPDGLGYIRVTLQPGGKYKVEAVKKYS